MRDSKLKIIFGLTALALLISLIVKLTTVPGGLILSGLVIGGIFLIVIVVCCLIVAMALKLLFKKSSLLTLYFIILSISFVTYHYYLYSPTLKIIAPDNYIGEVSLV